MIRTSIPLMPEMLLFKVLLFSIILLIVTGFKNMALLIGLYLTNDGEQWVFMIRLILLKYLMQ